MALYTILLVALLREHWDGSIIWLPFFGAVFWAVLLAGFYVVVIKEQVNELKHGLMLDDEGLDYFGKKIPNGSLIQAETVRFHGSVREVLMIGYRTAGKRRKLKTILLAKNDTESIFQLRDELRKVMGLTQQTTVSQFTWADWQAALRNGR